MIYGHVYAHQMFGKPSNFFDNVEVFDGVVNTITCFFMFPMISGHFFWKVFEGETSFKVGN